MIKWATNQGSERKKSPFQPWITKMGIAKVKLWQLAFSICMHPHLKQSVRLLVSINTFYNILKFNISSPNHTHSYPYFLWTLLRLPLLWQHTDQNQLGQKRGWFHLRFVSNRPSLMTVWTGRNSSRIPGKIQEGSLLLSGSS